MNKKLITLILLSALFSATSCNEKNEQKNLLLADEVNTTCVTELVNEINPDWVKGFDRLKFFKTVFDITMAEKVRVRGGMQIEDTISTSNFVYTGEDVKKTMENHVDTFDLNLIKEIRFLEKWNLNSKTFKFTKEVNAWSPIKIWEQDEKTMKQMVFFVYPEIKEKGKLIAQNIIYEHPWYQEYPNLYTGFDQIKFLQKIIDGVKSGTLKVYDPIYIVDKSKRPFNLDQLKAHVQVDLNPLSLNDYVYSIVFEEDWYFNEETFAITKDVKSIALIKADFSTEELKKSFMFFIIPE